MMPCRWGREVLTSTSLGNEQQRRPLIVMSAQRRVLEGSYSHGIHVRRVFVAHPLHEEDLSFVTCLSDVTSQANVCPSSFSSSSSCLFVLSLFLSFFLSLFLSFFFFSSSFNHPFIACVQGLIESPPWLGRSRRGFLFFMSKMWCLGHLTHQD